MNTYKKSRRLSCTMCRRAFRTAKGLKTHSCSKGGGGVLAASPQFREVKKPSRKRGRGANRASPKQVAAARKQDKRLYGTEPKSAGWAYYYVEHPDLDEGYPTMVWSEHAFSPSEALTRAKREWMEEEGLPASEASRFKVVGKKPAYREPPRK